VSDKEGKAAEGDAEGEKGGKEEGKNRNSHL
jgi:hypothetical protein